MKKLETIQTKEKLNDVFAVDEIGPGGANHMYMITPTEGTITPIIEIQLQKGPRKEEDSIRGVIDTDLLEIVRDRLTAFQNGPFACKYNADALEHVEGALKALNQRIEDRINRNVLGKNEE